MIYVALLRGINVGGNNKVSMAQLKTVFEALGFGEVKTYINSGNVIFKDSGKQSKTQLRTIIENGIQEEFGFAVQVVLQDGVTIQQINESVPEHWVNGGDMKCDIMFLSEAVDSPEVLKQLTIKPEIEDMQYVPGALLWRIDRKNFGKSRVLKMVGTDLYKNMTLRNVNTLRKLNALIAEIE